MKKEVKNILINDEIKRGAIFYVKSDPHRPEHGAEVWSDRPAVIVSNDKNNKYSPAVEVVFLTTKQKHAALPTHVQVHSSGKIATALCEQVHTIDKERLSGFMGNLKSNEMHNISTAIALGLEIHNNDKKRITGLFSKWEKLVSKYHLPILQENDLLRNCYKQNQSDLEMLRKERDSYKTLYECMRAKYEPAVESL